jgi:dihydroflavonol-4-reductase
LHTGLLDLSRNSRRSKCWPYGLNPIMTTLLTGGSGFLGGWIARALSPVPGELRVLARPSSNLSTLEGLAYTIAEGDLLDPDSLLRAMAGVKRVYHAAGWISFKRRDDDQVRRINYDGTVNLFRAAQAAGVERVVYTASIFALGYATDPSRLVTEDQAFNAGDFLDIAYLRAKRDAEQAAKEAIAAGLPLIRLYPGLCLGPNDLTRSSSAAIDAWLNGRMPAIITGGGICLMDVRDAAAAHVAAMQLGQPGEPYLATGHNVTLTELYSRLQALTGRRPPPLHLPPTLGVPLAGLAERAGILPAFDRAQARLMGHHWWYDSTRAVRELGVTFRPLDETLRDTVDWLRVDAASSASQT